MKVTYKEIAEAARVSKSKVEADRRRGLFDKEDLRSVALYIASFSSAPKIEKPDDGCPHLGEAVPLDCPCLPSCTCKYHSCKPRRMSAVFSWEK